MRHYLIADHIIREGGRQRKGWDLQTAEDKLSIRH